jgi:ribosome production factor 1
LADEMDDEFSPYFSCVIKPKVIITTRPRPSAELFHFISALLTLIPNSYYYPRRDYELKEITEYSRNKMFSHLIVLSEKSKKCNGMLVSHLGVPAESSGIWKDDGKKVWEDEEGGDEEEEDWGEDEEMGGVDGGEDGKKGEEDSGEENEGENDENDDQHFDDHNDHDDDHDDDHGDDDDDDDDDDENPFPPPPSPAKAPTPTADDVLPGPTAFFKVNNIVLPKRISNHGTATSHIPELILNNFTTRLGHRAGRFFGSLFPHEPEFRGRQAVTFHNQRDYVFVRHHRYVFHKGERKGDNGKTRARLQELGPRFSLKMRWMLAGGFDTRFGEYEFFHKRKEMDTSRRKFHM